LLPLLVMGTAALVNGAPSEISNLTWNTREPQIVAAATLGRAAFRTDRRVAATCHLWHVIGMKFEELMVAIGDGPLFETGFLLAGSVDPTDVRRQLSRWTRSGKAARGRRMTTRLG